MPHTPRYPAQAVADLKELRRELRRYDRVLDRIAGVVWEERMRIDSHGGKDAEWDKLDNILRKFREPKTKPDSVQRP